MMEETVFEAVGELCHPPFQHQHILDKILLTLSASSRIVEL